MRLEFLDFNDFYSEVNVITNHEPIDPKTKKFNPDGIFSETIFGRLDNEGAQFSCDCKKYRGKFYLGKKCETCETEVRFIEPIIKRIGWIDLGPFYIVNPNFYNFLSKIFSKSNLLNVISYEKKLTKDGLVKETENAKHPYSNIGLIEFKEKFDEILDYFFNLSKNKNKEEYYRIVKENQHLVFTNKIPVFSTTLRPALMMKDNLIFDEINNMYNSVILNSNMVKTSTEDERSDINTLPIMVSIQLMVNQIFEKTIDNIKGKTGFIRNNIMGSRVNFSARNVITPLPAGYEIDDIVVPYLTFLELYKFQLLNLISSVKSVSFVEAHHIWNEAATHFDPEMYRMMKEILNKTKGGLKLLLNRNPSINFGSILLLKIADIKQDYNDLTSSIHNNILAPLGGDYDGDTLNIIPLMDNSFKDAFRIYSPKLMFINANNGKFNSDLSIDRDQMLGMFSFNQ
jgi:DNA-directed RNA polymerase beta' subunit